MADAAAKGERDPFELLGTTIADKYRIQSIVGAGGFGVVYRGEHGAFGEPIAIKCLNVSANLSASEQDELLHKLEEEGAVLHRLSKRCAAIVQALDVGAVTTASGHWVPYLVLEWLDGQTLAEFLARRATAGEGGLTLEAAMELLNPAVDALALAHRQRVAHRDVKPENLFLSEADGTRALKVLDFGIAKVLAAHATFTASPAATLDRPTAFTPRYGAPEQFNKRLGATGPWTDVFALALILVELVSGQRALQGDDPTQLYVAATDPKARPTLRLQGVTTSDAVEAVLGRALAIEPQDRYPDAQAFWDALRAAAPAPARFQSAPPTRFEGAATQPSRPRPLSATSAPTVTSVQAGQAGSTPPPGPATLSSALDYPAFEVAVISLASENVEVTVANVVAKLGLQPHQAEAWLGQMEAAGRIDRSAKAQHGLVVYQVRGLTVSAPSKAEQRLTMARRVAMKVLHIDPTIEPTVALDKRKSVPFGVALAMVIPGMGLWYAAPLTSALIITIFGAIAIGILGNLPLLGGLLAVIAPIGAVLLSGLLGGAYTFHYNRHGKRTPLRAVRYRKHR
ncbi:MAG: serine/threonine protein kinase [Deltaproteobacteria bacterium]|nr:serine/threonine protein kinase [Deltaproteobacteria bacterium]